MFIIILFITVLLQKKISLFVIQSVLVKVNMCNSLNMVEEYSSSDMFP